MTVDLDRQQTWDLVQEGKSNGKSIPEIARELDLSVSVVAGYAGCQRPKTGGSSATAQANYQQWRLNQPTQEQVEAAAQGRYNKRREHNVKYCSCGECRLVRASNHKGKQDETSH